MSVTIVRPMTTCPPPVDTPTGLLGADLTQLLTVSAAARLLKVHTSTIRRWIRTKALTSVKVGHSIRIPMQSLIDFVNNKST